MGNQNVIEVSRLTRRFGRTTALIDVELTAGPGEVYGLVGPNGAGKTTLIQHLLGLLKPQDGSVSVFGADPVREPVRVLSRIGYLSEDRDLPDWMTVAELMRYHRAFFPAWDPAFAAELRDAFELTPEQRIGSLSRGQRARAGLLAAVAHRPPLLILDEPSSGLDPVVRRDILSMIIRTIAGEGRTVLFSSHLLDEVQRVADRVTMLHQGRTVLTASVDEILLRHRLLTFRFAVPPRTAAELPAAVGWKGESHEWTCLWSGSLEEARAAVAAAGGELVEVASPSLEDVFLARVATGAPHRNSTPAMTPPP